MRKPAYGKMTKLFADAANKHYQVVGSTIYFSDGHYIVKMPVDIYDREIAENSNGAIKKAAEILETGESAENLRGFIGETDFDTMLCEARKGDYRDPKNNPVTVINSTTHRNGVPIGDPVILNRKFYDAAVQMTRGGMMRCGEKKTHPVFFLDNCAECWHSKVIVMVLPVNYAELPQNRTKTAQDAA